MAFWEDTQRFLSLPRLKNREVLAQAVIKGAGSRDFFGTAEVNPAAAKVRLAELADEIISLLVSDPTAA
jgi:hypothetical protein